MSLEGKTEEDINALKEQLLEKVREVGGKDGNVSLLRDLGWEEDIYWAVRDQLVDAGLLTLGKGKGGSVRLVEVEASTGPAAGEAVRQVEQGAPVAPSLQAFEFTKEEDLYDPIAKVLQDQWTKDNRFQSSLVEITARQGKRLTGGTWSRPDITVVGYSVFLYLPGRHLDVATFEIKPATQITVTAVYEALAHRRGASRSYVIYHVPEELLNRELEADLEEIASEAKRQGIGLIVAAKPDTYETWDERVEAARVDPDPHKLNDFIAVQVSDGGKERILKWFK